MLQPLNKDKFEYELQVLVNQANQEELELDYVYDALNRQALIAETILRLSIERAYKERFN